MPLLPSLLRAFAEQRKPSISKFTSKTLKNCKDKKGQFAATFFAVFDYPVKEYPVSSVLRNLVQKWAGKP